MRHRPLGASGIEASVVGLGTWVTGGWMWGGADEQKSVRAIQAAIDEGINLVDTAPVYGFGQSEEVVGKAIRDRRDRVVLATKCGLIWHAERGQFRFASDGEKITPEGDRKVYKCQAPDVVRYEIEQSLRRLGVDHVDLLQTHWQDETTPIAETMGELMKLKAEGKIRAIGCSNATTGQMDAYRAAGRLDADQEPFSMLDRKHQRKNLPYCAQRGIAFLAYSPLAQGLLTGKVGPDREFDQGDLRRDKPRFAVENRRKVQALLDAIRPIAEAHDLTLAQLAIAWTVAQPGCTHALVGARRPQQALENAQAGDVTLTDVELATIATAIQQHAADIP